VAAPARYDCQACGACCANPDENRREHFVDYVEVGPGSRLLTDPVLRKRYVAFNAEGAAHLRLDPSGRCAALLGRMGTRVRCAVYADRPRGCRLVEAGSARCLQARRERGVDAERGRGTNAEGKRGDGAEGKRGDGAEGKRGDGAGVARA
jgi:Fe-S-cluster containining protein